MGAIVNRDLQQRIRTINGLTLHQQVAKSDIKNAAKIVQNFDNRWKMWDDATDNNSSSSRPVRAVIPHSMFFSDSPLPPLGRIWDVVSGGSEILTQLSLCYSIVCHYNGAQWYEQFLQVSRLDRTLILFGLALLSTCLSLVFMLLYIFLFHSLHFNELSLVAVVGLAVDLVD